MNGERATEPRSIGFTRLSLVGVGAQLEEIARAAHATFGGLDRRQLNWRPDASRWSVAQCFEHLLTGNRLMFQAADDAMRGVSPPTIWQRLPIWPRLFGQLLIRSQAPNGRGRYRAPALARPATSTIDPDVIERFVKQHRDAMVRLQSLDERQAGRTIMTSPFARVATYSVLDGFRLVVAHDWRHVEQARRVTLAAGFPELRDV